MKILPEMKDFCLQWYRITQMGCRISPRPTVMNPVTVVPKAVSKLSRHEFRWGSTLPPLSVFICVHLWFRFSKTKLPGTDESYCCSAFWDMAQGNEEKPYSFRFSRISRFKSSESFRFLAQF